MPTDADNEDASVAAPDDTGGGNGFPTTGFKVGEYVIENILGHGSMSTVFLATDTTGHQVALKVLQEGPQVSDIMLERFRREIEACKILRPHPNIITVFNTGRDGPNHYIAMRLVEDSRTLEDLVHRGTLTTREILDITIKIARALHYGHEQHIVHRDVKPTNIMINRFGEPLLTDFGTAALTDLPSFTIYGSLTGTPLYMSPEQARGEPATYLSDVYCLAVVLYEAVTGFLPYRAQHLSPVRQVLRAVQNQQPRRPRSLKRGISRDLESVILKALEKKPENRYSDAEAFAKDLENVREGLPIHAKPFSFTYYTKHQLRRFRRSIATIGALTLAALGVWTYFSSKVLEARYEGLIGEARLRNAEIMLASASRNAPSAAARAAPAWTRIRASRKAMAGNRWENAIASLDEASRLADASQDRRTKAIVELEQARCLTMLDREGEAAYLYASILNNPDAAPTTAQLAHLEGLGLAVVHGDEELVSSLLDSRVTHEDNPLLEAVLCLAGQVPVDDLLGAASDLPLRYRNDIYFVAALRRLSEQDDKQATALFRECLASSKGRDWPAPRAEALLARLRK